MYALHTSCPALVHFGCSTATGAMLYGTQYHSVIMTAVYTTAERAFHCPQTKVLKGYNAKQQAVLSLICVREEVQDRGCFV